LNVAADIPGAGYGWASAQVLEPGLRIQYSKSGFGQPDALPVMATAVPGVCGDVGETDAVTEAQEAAPSVYARPTKASLHPMLLHMVPPWLLLSAAHTEK
jgi:hypothetical protein